MVTPLGQSVELLKTIGVYDVVLPFILITAVLYAILENIKVFGKDAHGANLLTGIVIAFFVIGMTALTKFMQIIMPMLIGFFVVILLMVITFKFLGAKDDDISGIVKKPLGALLIISCIIILALVSFQQAFPEQFLRPEQIGPNMTVSGQQMLVAKTIDLFKNPTMLGIIVIFVIFAVATYFITYGGAGGGGAAGGGDKGGDKKE